MADAYSPVTPAPDSTISTEARPDTSIVFHGSPRNMAVGISLLLAGALAFTMGMTQVFFAEAVAWVFVIWGALFLFSDLVDYLKTWVVTDEALVIRSPARFWAPRKVWDWEHVNRLDLLVKRIDPKVQDVEMQVYYTPPGDTVLEREDRAYSEALVRLILERANLKPTHAHNPASFSEIPSAKATYIWNRSGKFAVGG
jgi:hypothetical protein